MARYSEIWRDIAPASPVSAATLALSHSLPAPQAVDCSKQQLCIDVWACHSAYADLATLALLARHTGGSVQHFPAFSDVAAGARAPPPRARARCSALIPPAARIALRTSCLGEL